MKIYVSFGTSHSHVVNGIVYDANCLAEVECENHAHGRRIAAESFGQKFCTTYEKVGDILRYFPRGVIRLN